VGGVVDDEAAPAVIARDQLSAAEVTAILGLQATTQQHDGAPPLNDAALAVLHQTGSPAQHLLAYEEGVLTGYAQLAGSAGSVVVRPAYRRGGLGTRLVRQLQAQATTGLQLWAVGNSPAAQALAASTGLSAQRTLLIMRRPTDLPLPPARLDAGTTVRTFQPGTDDADWLALNARAFDHHPEQGSLTQVDLELRMTEPWFDPGGFFLAVEGAALVGFHWTKQHPDRLGEVYVLGVDPAAGGRGLGRALLTIGLAHLRDRGNLAVQLYVEADHQGAVGLYRASGFVEVNRDVMYAQPTQESVRV